MGRYKEYKSEAALWKAVKSYFDSITREDPVLEPHDTGEFDRYGHKIIEMIPAKNRYGEEVMHTVYLIPPKVGDLCEHLKISSSTWHRYSQDPKFEEVTEWARDRFINWRAGEFVTRPDKMIGGIKADLELNYKVQIQKPEEPSAFGGELRDLKDSELQEMAARLARRSDDGNHA